MKEPKKRGCDKRKSRSSGHHYRHGRRGGPIESVVRGLSNLFGVPKGMIIGGYVVGFVFTPILALMAFLASWAWVTNPERFETWTFKAVALIRRQYERALGRSSEPRSPAPLDSSVDVDFPDLRRKFEELEQRAAGMETFVTSEEMALRKKFRDI